MGMTKRPLTSFQQQQIIDWLNSKARGSFHCAICKDRNWSVQEYLSAPFTATTEGTFRSDAVYPYAQVMCQTCGNTHFVNASLIGIMRKQ